MRTQNKYIKNKRNKNDIFKKAFAIILLLLLTFIVSLSLRSNPFSEFLPGHDSSMFQYFGYAMNNGKIMYTEIFDHKGPMIFIINYLGALLTSTTIQGIYILEFLSLFIYFLFSYKTIKLWLSRTLSFIAVIPHGLILMSFLEGGNLTEEYALPFIAISLFIFSKYFINPDSVHSLEVVFLGIACAIVFSLRANMVVVWLAFCLVISLKTLMSKKYLSLLKYALYFSLGLLLVFVPIGLYLYINGALEAAIFQSLTFNIMYLDDSASQSDAAINLYSLLRNHYIVFIFAAFLVYVAFKWKNVNNNKRYLYIGIILFSIGSFITTTLSGRDYRHYLMAMVPIVTIPTALLLQLLPSKMRGYKIIPVAILFIGLTYYPRIEDNFNNMYVLNTPASQIDSEELNPQEGRIINNKNQRNQIMEVAQTIRNNSSSTDEIYVHRFAGNLYLLSDRLSSIKYFNLPAVDLNENPIIGEDFLSDIIQSDTELIVLGSSFNNAEKTGAEQTFFDYVTENYNLIYDENNFHIYKIMS